MIQLHLPWLELTILIPLAGALWVSRLRDPEKAQAHCVVFGALTLLCAVGAWQDFNTLHAFEAHDRWDLIAGVFGEDFFVIDELSAPLIPLGALLYLMVAIATLRTKVRRFSFSWTLISESILLATLSCKNPGGVVVLLALSTIPAGMELRARRKPMRVYVVHMALFVALLVAAWVLLSVEGAGSSPSALPIILLVVAVMIRSGIVPVHCWMTDLFEHATFGTALLTVTPMVGAYAAMRLILPVAPGWALQGMALISLFTAVYAAGMALVQHEARRFFCYLFLSHSALVLVGLEIAAPIGLTGALAVWLSVSLALAGFGLCLRSTEARMGRLSLDTYYGLYEHMPTLAAFFLLTGLASVGFPGTIGFVGTELLIEGAVRAYPWVGMSVVFAAALNGIAVINAYLRLFTGKRHVASISLRMRTPERIAVLTLTALIVGGGIYPQPGIASRYHAAMEIVKAREGLSPGPPPAHHGGHEAAQAPH
jgi:NADH-quinone oxidoreductase subunit M